MLAVFVSEQNSARVVFDPHGHTKGWQDAWLFEAGGLSGRCSMQVQPLPDERTATGCCKAGDV